MAFSDSPREPTLTISGQDPSAWESLAPWEKAREWQDAHPDLANEIISLGRQRALMVWQFEKEDADHRRGLQTADAEHRYLMDKERASQTALTERRLWYAQLIALAIGFISVVLNSVISIRYAQEGNLTPGLAIFGAGGVLTGGVYWAARSLGKSAHEASRKSVDGHPPSE